MDDLYGRFIRSFYIQNFGLRIIKNEIQKQIQSMPGQQKQVLDYYNEWGYEPTLKYLRNL